MLEKLRRLVKKQNTDAKIAEEMELTGDGFTSAENPIPKSEAFKSKPIIITVVIIVIAIAASVFLSHRVAKPEDDASAEKDRQAPSTGLIENDSTKSVPGTYSELAKFKAKQAEESAKDKKTETKEEPLIKPRQKSYQSIPAAPAVPQQPQVNYELEALQRQLKEKDAANRSPIEFKVNR
jgi:hypothetical protein